METITKAVERAKAFSIEKFDIVKNDNGTLNINLQGKSNLIYEPFELSVENIYLAKNFIPDVFASIIITKILEQIIFKNIIKPIIPLRDYIGKYVSMILISEPTRHRAIS